MIVIPKKLSKIVKDQKIFQKKFWKKIFFWIFFFKIMNWGLKLNYEIEGIRNCEIMKCGDPLFMNFRAIWQNFCLILEADIDAAKWMNVEWFFVYTEQIDRILTFHLTFEAWGSRWALQELSMFNVMNVNWVLTIWQYFQCSTWWTWSDNLTEFSIFNLMILL